MPTMASSRRPLQRLVPLAFAVALVGGSAPSSAQGAPPVRLVKGPYLTGLSDSGVDVRFELDSAAPASIEVGLESGDAATPRTFDDRTASDMHVLRAADLAPATRYAYAVRAGGKVVGGGRFRTAPRPDAGGALRFLVYGDTRSGEVAHAAVARALASSPADFLVNTGDMVEDGGRAEDWQSFFDIESALLRDRALFVAIGNHELYDDRAGANFARYFGFAGRGDPPRPYGSARIGNIRFFFLNAMHDWGSGEERQWLDRELTSADTEPGLVWRIAVMHQGPWSSGPHGGNTMLRGARVPEMLAAHGIDLIFAGHDHIYERGDSDGLKYVVSGGGGAPLYQVAKQGIFARKDESSYHFVEVATDGRTLGLVARRIDGSVLDQCGFEKGRGWNCDPAPDAGTKTATRTAAAAAPSTTRCSCVAPGARAGSVLTVVALSALLGAARAGRRRPRH
jgi:hypothetical protein